MSSLNSEKLTRHFNGADQDAVSNYEDMVRVLPISHASVDCRACSGKGYRELSADQLRGWAKQIARAKTPEHRDQARRGLSRASDCTKCRGTGKVSAPRGDHSAAMDSMWTTVRCGSCRGGGEVTNPTDTSAERQDVCLVCGGDAYIVPVTVRASKHLGSGGRGGSATDGDCLPAPPPTTLSREHDLDGKREIKLEIEALHAKDPQLAAALASFHGHEAVPWVGHRWGRGFVVWQHTPAGRLIAHEVAEQSERRAGFLVAPTRLLALARDQLEMPGDAPVMLRDVTRLRVLMARADREARELLRRMQAVVAQVESAA